MNPSDESAAEESFTAALVACDEALAQGRPAELPLSSVSPQLRRRLEQARGVLHRLEQDRRAPRPTPGPVRLGRFRIVRELGRGGFGVVYLAHDPTTARDVALKVPRPEALVTPELSRRFLREAHTAAGLDHPHLVPVYEARAEGPISYIASAYCPGGSLADWLRQQGTPMPWTLAARVVAAVADAVAYIHSRGIFHRDLKPANVLLHRATGDASPGPGAWPADLGVPRVCDFGLAKTLDDGPGDTRSVAILGTPAYMAPEQAAGRSRDVTPATDVYAAGAILYECLTGRPPFTGESDLGILRRVQQEPPVPPRRLQAGVPRDLEAVCLRCLEKDPARRLASAAALADELRRCLRGEPTLTRPPRWPARAARVVRRHPAVTAVLLLATILAGAAPLLRYATDPERRYERQVAPLLDQLSRGEAVDLIQPGGPMPPHRVRCLEGATKARMTDEGLVVSAPTLGIVELLPRVPAPSFRIEAELRYDPSPVRLYGGSWVGLSFAGRHAPSPAGVHHVTADVAYDEGNVYPVELGGRSEMRCEARLQLSWFLGTPTDRQSYPTEWWQPANSNALFPPVEGGGLVKPWRTLAVHVGPEGAVAFWGDDPPLKMGPLRHDDFPRFASRLREAQPVVRGTELEPLEQHRVSLMVLAAQCTVRRLRVVPLPPAD